MLTEESGDNKIRGGLLELVKDDDGGRRSMGDDFGFGCDRLGNQGFLTRSKEYSLLQGLRPLFKQCAYVPYL